MKNLRTNRAKSAFHLLTPFLVLVVAGPLQADQCADVYINSTRNFTSINKQQSELAYFFSKHCSKSGEINESASSTGIDLAVDILSFSFSNKDTSSRKKMEEFCRTGVQQNDFSSNLDVDTYRVVVESLALYNQCVEMENSGLRMTHKEAPPHSVVIHGQLTKNYLNISLTAIALDPEKLSCTSNDFTQDGSPIAIDGQRSLPITRNFAIVCTRVAAIEAGKTYYPSTSLGLTTPLGIYTVKLEGDELLGFQLGSEAKAKHAEMALQRDQAIADAAEARAEAADLQNRLDNVKVEVRTMSYGEYDVPSTRYFQPRIYCTEPGVPIGPALEAHARQECGERQMQIHTIGIHGGNKCGYGHYVITCITK